MIERDPYVCVWTDTPESARKFFGLPNARVENTGRVDDRGRSLFKVWHEQGQRATWENGSQYGG